MLWIFQCPQCGDEGDEDHFQKSLADELFCPACGFDFEADYGSDDFPPVSDDDDEDIDDSDPFGSCEFCDVNLYGDEKFDSMCDQCSWWLEKVKEG